METVPVVVPDDFDIQGHRGARGLAPENTLPSFEAALDHEVDTLELDVHLSQNDMVVVWHDPYVYASKCRSLAARTPLQLRATTRLEREDRARVRSLRAGHLGMFVCDKNPEPGRFPEQSNERTALGRSHYRIVTLSRLFAFVERYARSPDKSESQRANAASVRFSIEIKRDPEHPEYIDDGFDGSAPGILEKELVEDIRNHGLVDRVSVLSFLPEAVWTVGSLEPDIRLGVRETIRRAPLAEYADRGADIWSPHARRIDRELVREAHDVGLAVIPFTVDDPEQMRRLVELGVDGLITDRPDRLTHHSPR